MNNTTAAKPRTARLGVEVNTLHKRVAAGAMRDRRNKRQRTRGAAKRAALQREEG